MNIEVVGHPAFTTPLKKFQKKSKENRHLKIWIIGSKEFIQKEAFLIQYIIWKQINQILLLSYVSFTRKNSKHAIFNVWFFSYTWTIV